MIEGDTMVFDNIFNFANQAAGIFSVIREGTKPRPGEHVDFEDAPDDAYDDTHGGVFSSAIHGASDRAKVVREHSPEARAIMNFLGTFIDTSQANANTQSEFSRDPGSVSTAASAGMDKSSATVTNNSDLQKDPDLANRPRKSDFASPPTAPRATAETPSRSSDSGTRGDA